ncbi:hypothetical protein Tco_0650142 [Tanacetum coccineum]
MKGVDSHHRFVPRESLTVKDELPEYQEPYANQSESHYKSRVLEEVIGRRLLEGGEVSSSTTPQPLTLVWCGGVGGCALGGWFVVCGRGDGGRGEGGCVCGRRGSHGYKDNVRPILASHWSLEGWSGVPGESRDVFNVHRHTPKEVGSK